MTELRCKFEDRICEVIFHYTFSMLGAHHYECERIGGKTFVECLNRFKLFNDHLGRICIEIHDIEFGCSDKTLKPFKDINGNEPIDLTGLGRNSVGKSYSGGKK